MTISFTGLVAHRDPADFELRSANNIFDLDYLRALAQAHEAGGFDRVYGRDLIPLVRKAIADRPAVTSVAA